MKLISTLAAATLLSGCSVVDSEVRDAGAETSETRQIADFTSLSVGGPQDVTVTTGQAPGLRISGPENMVADTEIIEDGDTLRIRQKDGKWNWGWKSGTVSIAITVPAIERASLGGSGTIKINLVEAEEFEGRVSGSGDLEVSELNAKRTKLVVTGSGDIKVAGTSDDLVANVTGSGDIDGSGLTAKTAMLDVTGSGDISATVTGESKASVTGSGDINIGGGGTCTSRATGSGDVNCN